MSGPFFMPDLYSGRTKPPNFPALVAQPNIAGVIMKSTQGVNFAPSWFTTHWPAAKRAAQAEGRYGSSFLRGLYHYGTPASSGIAQADFVMRALDRAGGWSTDDMPVAWDLEGGQTDQWTTAGLAKMIDISSQFAMRWLQLTGTLPILYSGSSIRNSALHTKMGFQKVWTTHIKSIAKSPFEVEDVVLWQYVGDSKYNDPAAVPAQRKFPIYVPGWSVPGDTEDMNVVMDRGQFAASYDRVREILTGQAPSSIQPLQVFGGALLGAASLGTAFALTRRRLRLAQRKLGRL